MVRRSVYRVAEQRGAHPVSAFPVIDAARAIIRAELDLFHAQHGRPRPVAIGDLSSAYAAAFQAMGYPAPSSRRPDPKE
jgi:hypothetical protein